MLTSVLLVEDNLADALYVEHMLPALLYYVTRATSLASAHECIGADGIGVVLLDLSLPDEQGLQTCLSMIGFAPHIPIIILTGLADEDVALDAVKLGAQDYILKQDMNESTLSRSIRYAVERKRAEEEVRQSAIEAREAEAQARKAETQAREAEALARKAEAQAREAEANLKLSLKASGTGVWSWDILNDCVTTDEQVACIFGIEPGTFGTTLQSFVDHLHVDDKESTKIAIQTAIENKAEYAHEFRMVWSDGSIHCVAARGQVLIDASGVAARMAGVITEITKQREDQENAKRLAMFEQREDFIATLSHDLKNPLIGADRILSMFVDGDLGNLEAKQRKLLALMKQSNADMLSLIRNQLDVYRFDQGAPPLDLTEVDVKSLAEHCINQLSAAAQSSEVELRAIFPAGNHTITADSMALQRVLANLLGNGMKFTGTRGTVTVSGSDLGDTYTLEIADSGPGIAASDLQHLFQRFSQTELGRKHGMGTGLGLYLCRQLVESHGGQIKCKSAEGSGTTFTIILPTRQ